jgi:polar amino acid transport system substrate-binding protein
MVRTHVPLRRAALIPLAVCALMFGGALNAAAQSPDASAGASMALPTMGPECAKDQLALKTPGHITISTDTPSYNPWWSGTPPQDSEWYGEFAGYPPSGLGFEGGIAVAIAQTLGFTPEEITWIPNTVFENAFAPGEKPFDYHLAQIAITPERAEAVDFSDPYLDSNQSLVALVGTPITEATTIEGLRDFKLGAATATTGLTFLESVIQPRAEISAPADNAALVQLLQNGQIDGLVADLFSAIYMRDVQLTGAELVGKFDAPELTDHVGMVLQKGSALTPCVNQAMAVIHANGTVQAIYDTWLGGGEAIRTFE